jgi:tetratricopeptide (TPR) repeat protein
MLAEIDRAQGKPCSALEKLSRARTLDSSGIVSDWEFARIYRELGRFDLAVESVKKLDDSFITGLTWVSFDYPLAGLYWDDEQYERASNHARAALAQARSIADGVKLIPYLQFLALTLADLGNEEEADPLLDEAETLFEAAGDPHLRSMSYVLTARVVVRMLQGRFAESDALITEALATTDRWPEAETGLQRRLDEREREALRAGLIYRRAMLRETEGRRDEAVAYFEQSLRLFEERYGRTNPRLARSLADYRRVLAATGDEAGAARQQARLDAIAAVRQSDPLRHCANESARGSTPHSFADSISE